jgi:two-component system chemotaxis response regulator CheY
MLALPFSFDIFLSRQNARSARTAVMRAGKRILVVDDAKTMTDIVFRILKDAKYADVDCLYDGVSALAALRQKEYDLVITDWQMEPISGVELTKLIKTDARLSKVRIILITGLHGKEDEAWLSGADGYVTKPFEPRDLLQKVEDVLSTVARLVS